jgi:hypothetical protein
MGRLLAEIEAHQEIMRALMDVNPEKMKACWKKMKAWWDRMEAYPKKSRGQSREEATWVNHMHTLTALQGQASNFLDEVSKGVTYTETTGATEGQFGDQPLAVGSSNQLKTRIQCNGESLNKSAIAIEWSTHHAFPAWHEVYIRRGTGNAFGNGMRDWGTKQELFLGGKGTLIKALRQTLGLEVIKMAVGSSIGLQKTSDRALWRAGPIPNERTNGNMPTGYLEHA